MAEWLCSGLQSRVRRFDSDFRLQIVHRSDIILKYIKIYGGVAECLCDVSAISYRPVQIRAPASNTIGRLAYLAG